MVGADIREAREETGLSRERVAAQLDPPVSSKTIERWENGSSPTPGWRKAQLLALYNKNGRLVA